MKVVINKKVFMISKPSSKYDVLEARNSYISITFKVDGKSKTLFLASSHYKQKSNELFYKNHQIEANINLLDIPHGNDNDIPCKTMPLFLNAAQQIDEQFKTHNSVLVNCNHGRSRTGSVVALYFMEFLAIEADKAIQLVSSILGERGYVGGIDLKSGSYGTYGEWIREYEVNKNKENIVESNTESLTIIPFKRTSPRTHVFFPPQKKIKIELSAETISCAIGGH
jgi:protein-tyrosine phosphatase